MAESELALIAPPGSGGHFPILIACLASPSAAFGRIVGYLHSLGSAGTVGLGSTSVSTSCSYQLVVPAEP